MLNYYSSQSVTVCLFTRLWFIKLGLENFICLSYVQIPEHFFGSEIWIFRNSENTRNFFLPRNPLPDMTKMCLGKNPASLSVILKPSGPDLLRHVTYILKTHWSFWNVTASILNCWFLPVWQAPLDPWNSNQLFWMVGKLELINRVACWGQEKADVTYHQVWPYLLTKVQKHERFV